MTPRWGDIHGVIRDAAPDAWGRRVQEARDRRPLTELDYLLGAGPNGVGAFEVTADTKRPPQPTSPPPSLATLITAAERVETGNTLPPELDRALLHGTSVGGARPKALLYDQDTCWLAKFSSTTDHYPVVRAEYAAMLLAARVGLLAPRVERVESLGRDVLLVERFDRVRRGPQWTRRQLVSALTALRLHETEARLASYLDLAAIIRRRARHPLTDTKRLFRRMVFNILVGNTDDHARNHAFFWDGRHLDLTPVYDICPDQRSGRTASQAMTVGAEGRAATLRNARSEAGRFGLTTTDAKETIDHLTDATRTHWPEAAARAGLTALQVELLERETILGPGCFE